MAIQTSAGCFLYCVRATPSFLRGRLDPRRSNTLMTSMQSHPLMLLSSGVIEWKNNAVLCFLYDSWVDSTRRYLDVWRSSLNYYKDITFIVADWEQRTDNLAWSGGRKISPIVTLYYKLRSNTLVLLVMLCTAKSARNLKLLPLNTIVCDKKTRIVVYFVFPSDSSLESLFLDPILIDLILTRFTPPGWGGASDIRLLSSSFWELSISAARSSPYWYS